ncbi:MAG: invasion associated locus B family protein [Thalassovita sp.]
MPKFLNLLPVVAVMGLTSGALAQDTASSDATEGAPAAATDLNLGEVVEPAQTGPYIRETSGDWSLFCDASENSGEVCQLFQALLGEEGQELATIRLFRLEGQGPAVAGATVAVPLETLLTAQLTISVDNAPSKRYPYTVCDRLGCYARIGLTQEDVDAFKRGAKATIALVPFVAPDHVVTADISLTGFTAGYDLVSVSPQ